MWKLRRNNGCIQKLKSFNAKFQKTAKELKRSKRGLDFIDKESLRRLESITIMDLNRFYGTRAPRYLRRGTRTDFLHNGSFHEAVGPMLVMAQCFCLMPVRGIRARSVYGLSFSWRSFRTWYCLFYMLTTFADSCFTMVMVYANEVDVRNLEPMVFHVSIFLSSAGFLRLASKWPRLMRRWALVEQQLPPHTTWTSREELSRKIRHVTFVLIMLSLTEHLLSTISAIHFANYCPSRKDPVESYLSTVASQIFYVFEFSTWLGWVGKVHNILMTFGWSYMDIFVTIMGIGLSSLYKQIQVNIVRVQDKAMSDSFWSTTRMQYRMVCELISEVDDAISAITMISFANNLYFVCLQLLKSINKMPSVAHGVYFYFSLLFLLGRTLAVSLFLAEVNERARHPLVPLRHVPRDAYGGEAERFANEVATDVVALTGLKLFSVTRKLVPTVVGTILTYELVLLQFHEDQNLWNCGEE